MLNKLCAYTYTKTYSAVLLKIAYSSASLCLPRILLLFVVFVRFVPHLLKKSDKLRKGGRLNERVQDADKDE